MFDVMVIGGGAAGLASAIAAGRAGCKVMVLEKRERLGRKILASGNGRCNLGNVDLSPSRFSSQDHRLLSAVLSDFSLAQLYAFWGGLGLELTVEEGRIYPRTMQSKSVLEVLLYELARLNVGITLSAPVIGLSAIEQDQGFEATCQGGAIFRARAAILALGGMAAPQLGCTGDGYALAAALGHTLVRPAPALVGLRLASRHLKELAGLRLRASVSIPALAATETGEVIFTEYGLSGIPVFDLTACIGQLDSLYLHLRLAEQATQAALMTFLVDRLHLLSHKTMREVLVGYLPTQLVSPILSEAGIPLELPATKVLDRHLDALGALLWDWTFPIDGLNTWEQAQTTWGGIPLREVGIPALESKKHPGLYLAGELLDVHGRCGGYNLYWAFASGYLAGQHAALGTRTSE